MLECCKCGQQASERAYCACGLYNGVAGVVPESPEYQAPARVAPAIMYVPVPLAVTVPVPVNTTQTAESTDITRDVQSRFHIHYTARTMAKAERQQFRAMAAAAPGNGQRSQSPGVIAYLQAVTTLAISCGVDLPEASAACAGYAAGLEQMIGAGSGDAHRNFVAAIAVLYAFLAADEESWPRPDCALVESEVASRIIEHMASAEAPKQPASIRLRAGLMAVAAAERAIGNPAISRIIDTQMRAAAFCGRHALPEWGADTCATWTGGGDGTT
ncbi:hypothetical protein JKP88DRAFT_273139 [Tribonema minus]|uniref:Uncharacterized protein n=1 Tax=Tribonema minus TaxID=303371 RepID=A0A835Z024_9STRA|nr:hypothetical protein JKP88DRAFT_273139 [Tribonema minus]